MLSLTEAVTLKQLADESLRTFLSARGDHKKTYSVLLAAVKTSKIKISHSEMEEIQKERHDHEVEDKCMGLICKP